MKQFIFSTITVIVLIPAMTGCRLDDTIPADELKERKDFVLTRSELDFIQNNNDFAFDLFRNVSKKENGKSFVISPLSVTIDLGMVNNGAAGSTRDEINKVLGYEEGSMDGLNAFCQSMMKQSVDVDPSTTLEIANAAFINKNVVPLKDGFTKTIKSVYDAEVLYKDSGKDDIKGLINQWCSKKTKGMIPVMLENQPSPLDYAHFLNAVYFKGVWSNKFQKSDTKKEKFTLEDGKQIDVKMMCKKDNFKCDAISGVGQVLCLPYGNQAYRMMVLLPHEGKTIDDVISILDADMWGRTVSSMPSLEVDIKLPSFESEYSRSLKEILEEMGIRSAFSSEADFSEMTDAGVLITDVRHKAKIKVDEQGSEAAAVTQITMMLGASGITATPQVVKFHADHPFLYIITEVSSGAIYFIGQYTGK